MLEINTVAIKKANRFKAGIVLLFTIIIRYSFTILNFDLNYLV
jgi:hypothetical protein